MANCTDLPFRLMARAHGMRFAFLEMLSADRMVRCPTAPADDRLQTIPEDRPVGAQLMGCDPAIMGEAAAQLEAMGYDLVDLNLGCPVPKVVGHGGGSSLLREPSTAEQIFRRVVRSVRRVPVTVKMRLGYSDASGDEAIRIARLAEEAGVDALAVHGRTRSQGYSGTADYEAIGRVKRAVKIPVFGNGDVVDGASARRLKAVSGCDGVMLGRGALGNPWIYRDVEAALRDEPSPPPPDLAARKAALWAHLDLQCRYERDPVGPLRRIIVWYSRDLPHAAQFRDAIHRAQTVEAMRELIETAFGEAGLRGERPGLDAVAKIW
ncbi:MAG: tRNA dihydrouridine synthase DusB [Omnitrophica WOR_2 bacterium RIFCSPHIGHO2_02_FULL_68_15]|nr:MAG: tRNA dihydrouridine synthase DusB [Omnitrophica WOR_2 bacterium RIFCSPHIGHO2_02_FULL_68_15]